MALRVPFVSSVYIGLTNGSLLWGLNQWEMYQHRHACRRRLSFSLGALDIAMAWEIYLLKPQAQHEWALLFIFFLHPTLSIVLAISFWHFLASDLVLYHTLCILPSP